MKESISIHFEMRENGGYEVGVHYHPGTSEWEMEDKMLATERALHALTLHAIALRQQRGLPVPEALKIVDAARTFESLR